MVNSNYSYQYETSPRKLEPQYKPQKKKSTKKTNNASKNKNTIKVKNNKKLKLKAVGYLAIGFIILFTISYRNSVINESFSKKEDLKQELNAIKKTNEQLQVGIENALNLNSVEQSAKERLGMQKPDNSQKVYVNLEKKDYIQSATEEVVIEDNSSWFQKLISGFTKSIK